MSGLEQNQLLTDEELEEAIDQFGEDPFKHGIGAEAVQDILSKYRFRRRNPKIKRRRRSYFFRNKKEENFKEDESH